jgi:hypothetical protein
MFDFLLDLLPPCSVAPRLMIIGAFGLGVLLFLDKIGRDAEPLAPWRSGEAPRRPHLEAARMRGWNVLYGALTGTIVGLVLAMHPCG